uniref:Methyltransferase domain-containing protein n=1 Tax=Plectus sambesii TaxID=2011161 RepID=A0A914XFS2_9BILA
MGCADVIEMDESGARFRIGAERAVELRMAVPFATFVPLLSQVFGDIESCFQPSGPNGVSYDKYTDFHKLMNGLTVTAFEPMVLPCLFTQMPDLEEKLSSGIICLDVGCGLAEPSRNLAKKFPNSQFYAIDFSASSIAQAKELASKDNLNNVHFFAMDAAQLDKEWTNKFDWVTAVDAIHDQAHPRKVLKEIVRVLKPGARFSMIDVKGTSNAYEDKKTLGGGNSAGHYIASLFHCMPVSLYFDGGEGLGTMWGAAVASELLAEAGLLDAKTFDTDHPVMSHYLSHKPVHTSNI